MGDNDNHTVGSVIGIMVGPAWSEFKPLADLAAIQMHADSEDLRQTKIDGVANWTHTFTGMWARNSPDEFTVHGCIRDLPRKDKKLLKKLWTCRPIGRRERARGIRFTTSGVKMRLLPD